MTEPELERLRGRISEIDAELIELLGRRMRLCSEIGRIKSREGLQIEVKEVERRILKRALELSREKGLEEELTKAVFRSVLKYSKERQRRERRGASDSDLGT